MLTMCSRPAKVPISLPRELHGRASQGHTGHCRILSKVWGKGAQTAIAFHERATPETRSDSTLGRVDVLIMMLDSGKPKRPGVYNGLGIDIAGAQRILRRQRTRGHDGSRSPWQRKTWSASCRTAVPE